MHKEKKVIEHIAKERIVLLFSMAEKMAKEGGSKELSRRYVRLVREIGMHYRVGIPRNIADRICKACNNPLVPGENCRVRITGGAVVSICECGEERRRHITAGSLGA